MGEYKWELNNICDIKYMEQEKEGGSDIDAGCALGPGKVMHAKGGWVSKFYGKSLIRVRDASDQVIFVIRRPKAVWNPFQLRNTVRIFAPLPKDSDYDNAEPLFTIQQDLYGKGFLWSRAEFRIYEGRVRDEKPLYYAIAGYAAWSRVKIY